MAAARDQAVVDCPRISGRLTMRICRVLSFNCTPAPSTRLSIRRQIRDGRAASRRPSSFVTILDRDQRSRQRCRRRLAVEPTRSSRGGGPPHAQALRAARRLHRHHRPGELGDPGVRRRAGRVRPDGAGRSLLRGAGVHAARPGPGGAWPALDRRRHRDRGGRLGADLAAVRGRQRRGVPALGAGRLRRLHAAPAAELAGGRGTLEHGGFGRRQRVVPVARVRKPGVPGRAGRGQALDDVLAVALLWTVRRRLAPGVSARSG